MLPLVIKKICILTKVMCLFLHVYGFCHCFVDYAARRDEIYGSWFVEEFILMLELFSHVDDLAEICRKVGAGAIYH